MDTLLSIAAGATILMGVLAVAEVVWKVRRVCRKRKKH